VDPPKRERKRIVSYAENQAATARKEGGKPSGPRLTRMPNLPDYQFFDVARITELYKKQEAHELHVHTVAQREAAMKAQGASDEVIVKELAPSGDDPAPLDEAELAERDALLGAGFSNWSRRDFNAFVRACEKHGRSALAEVAKEVEGKTEEEVFEYAAVFKERCAELNDAERILKTIERGEQRLQRHSTIMDAIRAKLERSRNPWQDLKIQYGPAKGKAYTEEEDRFLVCAMHQLGYGAWDEIKAEIRASWRFRFDWFIKSRTPQELGRRCDTLIRLIEKENEEDEERAAASKRKSGGGGGGGGAGKKKGEGSAAAGGDDSAAPSEAGAARKRKTSDSGGAPPAAKKGKE